MTWAGPGDQGFLRSRFPEYNLGGATPRQGRGPVRGGLPVGTSSWASPRCAVRPVVNGSGRGSPGGFVYTGLMALF